MHDYQESVSWVFVSVCTKKVWLPDRQTHGQTDAGQIYPYVPICFAGDPKNTQQFDLYCVHKVTSIFFFLLWPWTLTSRINRVYPLILGSICAKFYRNTSVWSLMCSHGYFQFCLLHSRPLPPKSIGMVNMSDKYDEDAHNSLVSNMFTRSNFSETMGTSSLTKFIKIHQAILERKLKM